MFASSHSPLPPITLAMSDYVRLMREVWSPSRPDEKAGRKLLFELTRARIAPADGFPEGTVRLNSRVTYRLDDEPRARTHLLVHPDDLRWPGAEISALSPLGIALIGLREGDEHRFRSECGRQLHRVRVERVGLQFPDFGVIPDPDEEDEEEN